jgi:hypothetical protein
MKESQPKLSRYAPRERYISEDEFAELIRKAKALGFSFETNELDSLTVRELRDLVNFKQ